MKVKIGPVVSFSIANAMTMSVFERTKEIVTLRALLQGGVYKAFSASIILGISGL